MKISGKSKLYKKTSRIGGRRILNEIFNQLPSTSQNSKRPMIALKSSLKKNACREWQNKMAEQKCRKWMH